MKQRICGDKYMNQFQNPIALRYNKVYNSLSNEQRQQWDNIEYLPKEQWRLKKIRRVRKPEISAGTIFALLLPENVYMFGKIVEDKLSLPNIEKDFFVAFISSQVSDDINHFPHVIHDENIILGPVIISDGLWKNGTFFTVGYEPLTEDEMNLDYGFFT